MKAISARALTTRMKELTEPVEVVSFRRDTGSVVTVGYFYPKGTEPKEVTKPTPVKPEK